MATAITDVGRTFGSIFRQEVHEIILKIELGKKLTKTSSFVQIIVSRNRNAPQVPLIIALVCAGTVRR
jgi:hypothetical protein